VLLAWALDSRGEKVHAGRLGPADRRRRAPFTCLGCGEPLVPHLGAIRVHHFAHPPGSACPLTAPETVLHQEAKERLLALCAEAFAGSRAVSLSVRCPRCRRPVARDLASLGDRARPEGALCSPSGATGARPGVRADVLVSARGRPSLALEVRVTHALGPEKEAALAAAGIPAVEIDARTAWLTEQAGRAVVASVRSVGFPPCPACAALSRAEGDRALGGEAGELAELETYRARGLFGPARVTPGRPGSPFGARERRALSGRFGCPDCGGRQIVFGARIARHLCPGGQDRPVAWRGYDGGLVELGWWSRDPRRAGP
jgi:ribosomal protein S27E